MTPQLATFLAEYGFPAADLDSRAEHGFTPLMRAAKLGRLDLIDELLTLGAGVSPLNTDGCNALWLACYSGDPELIRRLVAAGIDIDNQNGNGATCLMYVSSNGKAGLVKLLLELGADPGLRNFDDYSALDLAASVECLRLLRHAA